jgi:hypothetical protein
MIKMLNYTPLDDINPPSTLTVVPVTNFEASLSNQMRAPFNSCGFPNLLKGVCLIMDCPLGVRDPSGCVSKALF